jgi:conjugal transfer pilus assembly protein TraV
MKDAWRIVIIAAWGSLGAGCASTLSGVGGTPTYACKAPEGVLCTSVAGVYANSLQMNLPSQRTEKRVTDAAANVVTATRAAPGPNPAPNTGSVANTASASDAASIRSAPRVLRVWLAPWEDSDGDLQDQSYLYVVVDSGRWLIEHQRASIRNAYTPIAAPNAATPDASEPIDPTPSATANLPRPGVPSFPAGTTSVPPRVETDAESTLR